MKNLQIMMSLRKGFTLIELLIVIAVLGVLAAVVVSAIDPIDKINAGNDSKVIQDISVVGNALEAYAVTHDGVYPADTTALGTALIGSGDLKALPVPPTNYSCPFYNYARVGNGTTTPYTFTLSCTLKAKKTTATPKRLYDSATGKVCSVAASVTACPTI